MWEIIFKSIIVAFCAVFSYVLVPYIKTKVDKSKMDALYICTEYAVRCAEQLFSIDEGKEKKKYVYNYILNKTKEIGLKLDENDLNVFIEGMVNLIKYS